MSLDPRIRDAIVTSAEKHGQPATLADRLIGWLENLANGNERLDDSDSVDRHLDLLYDAVIVELSDDEQD